MTHATYDYATEAILVILLGDGVHFLGSELLSTVSLSQQQTSVQLIYYFV